MTMAVNEGYQTPERGTISVLFLRGLLDCAEERNVPQAALLKAAGLQPDQLQARYGRIPVSHYARLFEQAVQMTGDVNLGLHVGEAIKPGHLGVLGYAMMSCTTLGEAVVRLERYEQLVGDVGRTRLLDHGDHMELRWEPNLPGIPPRHVAEENLAGWSTFARWIVGKPEGPLAVHFQHEAPDDLGEHQRIFDCPLHFSQPHTGMIFSPEMMDLPLAQADPEMRNLMDQRIEELMSERLRQHGLIQKISEFLVQALQDGEPSLERVASELGMHERTLQRRLKELDMGYQQVLDSCRHQLALSYMDDDHLSLPDVAFLLGFAEQSSFARAFKRWTGMPPGKYRKQGADR